MFLILKQLQPKDIDLIFWEVNQNTSLMPLEGNRLNIMKMGLTLKNDSKAQSEM